MNHLQFDMSKPRDVVALGRSGVDLFPDQFGPMNQVISFSKYVGGSPANTAVQMAKMGIDVGFISKVSQDHFGQYVKYYMDSQGVDTSHMTDVSDPNIRHSLAVAEQPVKGSVNYFFYRKDIADLHLSIEDIDEQYIAQFKALLISGTSLCQSPAREAVLIAIEYARRNNVRVIFDPDHRDIAWNTLDEAGLYYWLAATKSDLIFGTREELDIVERLYQPGNTDDAKTAKLLLQYAPSMVCIKHGEDGSNVYMKDGTILHGNIYPAHVYKVLGAGDSFAGAFISRIVQDRPVEEALQYGAASASLTISGKACSASMPVLAQVEEFMDYCHRGQADEWPGWNTL